MPDSDSEAVYEFTQDAQHGDLRDPHSRRRRSLGLDVEPNSVLAFWRLICDTFRKIVNHPALRDKPMILETPNELPGYAKEIQLLRQMEI